MAITIGNAACTTGLSKLVYDQWIADGNSGFSASLTTAQENMIKAQVWAIVNQIGTAHNNDAYVAPTVEEFIAPTFQNSWVNFGAPYQVAGYMKDPFGFVHIRGEVKGGTIGSAMFTLPVGYRPAASEQFIVWANSAATAGVVLVNSSGQVVPLAGSNSDMQISGITFKAA